MSAVLPGGISASRPENKSASVATGACANLSFPSSPAACIFFAVGYQTRTLHLLRIIRHRIPCENAGKFYGPINCCDWTTRIKQGGNDAQENSIRSGDQ